VRIRFRSPFTFEPDPAPPRWLLWVARTNAHAAAIRAIVGVVAEDHERAESARSLLLDEARRLVEELQRVEAPPVRGNVIPFHARAQR
jgi:hypothetical protein